MKERFFNKAGKKMAMILAVSLVLTNTGIGRYESVSAETLASKMEQESIFELKLPPISQETAFPHSDSDEGRQEAVKEKNDTALPESENTVLCNLNFIISGNNETCDAGISSDNICVRERHFPNTVVTATDGKYLLKCDTSYQCVFTNVKGLTLNEGGFTVEKGDSDSAEQEITLACTLTIPQLQVNSISLDDVEQIKSDVAVSANCINFNDLYNSKDWKISVNTGSLTELGDSNIIDTSQRDQDNQIVLEYYYGTLKNPVKTQTFTCFDKYIIKAMYKGNVVSSEPEITFKEEKKKSLTLEDLEIDKQYIVDTLNVKGFIYTTDEKEKAKITFSLFTQEYEVELLEIILPKLTPPSPIIGRYKDTIEVGINNIEELSIKDWEVTCVKEKEDDSDEKLTANINEKEGKVVIQLDKIEGKYALTLQHKKINDIVSEKTVIQVNKRKIKFIENSNKVIPAEEKMYDGSGDAVVRCTVNSSIIEVEDSENKEFEGEFILHGVIQGAVDVGNDLKRDFKVVSVEYVNKGDEKKYDAEELIGQMIKIKITITKPVIHVNIDGNIRLAYRTSDIRWKESISNLQVEKKMAGTTDKIILQNVDDESKYYTLLKDFQIKANIKENTSTCLLEKLVKEEANERYIIENSNIKFIFKKNEYNYERISEIIDVNEIKDEIWLYQKDNEEREVKLGNIYESAQKQWVNPTRKIIGKIEPEGKYNGAYDKICFEKIDKIDEDSYKVDSLNGANDDITIDNECVSQYYKMIISDDEDKYPTLAAFIRIIKEGVNDGNSVYSNIAKDDDGNTYRIINLFLSEEVGKVKFEPGLGGDSDERNVTGVETDNTLSIIKDKLNDDDIEKKLEHIPGYNLSYCNQTAFKIENDGATLTNVSYAYLLYEGGNFSVVEQDWSEASVLSSDSYTAPLPAVQGDYIMLVKLVNEVGVESVYASTIFIMDRTNPKVEITYGTELPDGSTGPGTSEKERDYICTDRMKNSGESIDEGMFLQICIEEKNLKDIDIELTGTDGEGQSIEKDALLTDQQKEKIKRDLCNSKTDGVYTAKIWLGTSDNGDTDEVRLKKDANYTLRITAKDTEGNWNDNRVDGQTQEEKPGEVDKTAITAYYFTIDNGKPKGTVNVQGKFRSIKNDEGKKKGIITMLLEPLDITLNCFAKSVERIVFTRDKATVTMTGKDDISPVSISYYITDRQMTESELAGLKEDEWTVYHENVPLKTELNKKSVVYEQVQDAAGNISYFSSGGIISDNVEPEIEVTFKQEPNENGFYHGDVEFAVKVTDKSASVQNETAGIKLVCYRIENGAEITKAKMVFEGEDASVKQKKFTGTVSAEENNSNDVTLYVTAVDNAGNKKEYRKELKIDRVDPEITVSYDNNQVVNGRYYNQPRTATVRIKERNLDTEKVKLSVKSSGTGKAAVGEWSRPANAGKSDETVYTCQVAFTQDDDYIFSVSCEDEAGNKSKGDYREEFTVDVTKPVIAVSYNGQSPEQDAYYNEEITAVITITEHNFDSSKVRVQNEGSTGQGGSVVSAFQDNGDVHTASVRYAQDGEYRLSVSYTDEAGNAAEDYTGNRFVVDMTEPELEITNVRNQSANAGEVKPVVICRDENYDEGLVSITLTGANGGEIELKEAGFLAEQTEGGGRFTFDFPKTEKMDDVYILKARMEDKAGNEKEDAVEFSVNRFGSVYTLGNETRKWLENGVCSYIQEAKTVEIIETNVNEIVDRNITYNRGGISGDAVEIKDIRNCTDEEEENGLYYEVENDSESSGWCRNSYKIDASNFNEEGSYHVNIYSKDAAGNESSNISNRHADGKLTIEFAVDKTAPSVVFSGAEDGGMYNEAEHTVLVDVQDNIALSSFTVYVNDEEYGTYTAEQLEEYENGLVPVKVKQALSRQNIQVSAEDKAGNRIGGTREDGHRQEMREISILVTTNAFIRFLNTTWMLVLFIFILCIVGFVIYAMYRKRKRISVRNDSED